MHTTLAQYYGSEENPVSAFINDIKTRVNSSFTMGLNATALNDVVSFIGSVVYGYFYNDKIAYDYEVSEDFTVFLSRFCYDVNLKLPYWYRKYNYVKKLLTDADFSLLQTSKMSSSSNDLTKTAGGSLQKTATTPTGVSADSSNDEFEITISENSGLTTTDIDTAGFVDKYTNAQQKYANASRVEGERSGEILREGSIDELLNVLEKLPASFGNEIAIALQKHFIFDYDGEERGYYD